ncbi:MAG: hypothetical protein R3330_11780, partial [Saprospiraceae bacterium]|nr:hypothetical protein [Saprospiraceae bacterium]
KEITQVQLKGRKAIHHIGFRGIRAFNKLLDRLSLDLEVRSRSAADLVTSEDSMMYFVFTLIVKERMIEEYHYAEETHHHVYKLCSWTGP